MDLIPCGVIKVDSDRQVLSANQYALNLLSIESAAIVEGLNLADLITFASRIFLDSYVYPMLLNGEKASEIQVSLRSITGESVPIVANIQMSPDKSTYWTFMSCSNRDQLFNELLSARETLQAQAQALTRYNSQIQERQSDLQVFCHSLSHDFSGPLRNIHRLIEFALEELQQGGKNSPEVIKMLSLAQKGSETLMEMLDGLVDYMVADVSVTQNEEVNLPDIISTVLALCEQQDVAVPKVQFGSLPTLFGSKAQIQVLFKNLIENAIKYNDNEPEVNITHSEDAAAGRVIIAIQDNGIGMSKSDLERIFTPFTRLYGAARYTGSGLGLSIARKMVMNHGGEIRVDSTPGSGSTFYVSLPIKASSSDHP